MAAFDALIDRVRAEAEQLECEDAPETCDACDGSLEQEQYLIDGETRSPGIPTSDAIGAWAYMCARCFAVKGAGIGWGRGQLYERIAGRWLMVAGFPEETFD